MYWNSSITEIKNQLKTQYSDADEPETAAGEDISEQGEQKCSAFVWRGALVLTRMFCYNVSEVQHAVSAVKKTEMWRRWLRHPFR